MRLIAKNSILKILVLIILSTTNYWLASHILASNPEADLAKYIKGGQEFGISYFEPLAALYLEISTLISDALNFKSYLAFQSTAILLFFILFRVKFKPSSLIIFWVITLTFVIPLINVRYVTFFLVMLWFPRFISRILAALCHWNLVVLLIPLKLKLKQFLFSVFFVLPIIFYCYYYGYLNFIILKVLYYLQYAVKDYGIGLFIEIVLLTLIYKDTYRSCGASTKLIFSLMFLSLFTASLGFPIISSRVIVLSFLISLYELYDKRVSDLKIGTKIIMMIVCVYELYRVFSMIGI